MPTYYQARLDANNVAQVDMAARLDAAGALARLNNIQDVYAANREDAKSLAKTAEILPISNPLGGYNCLRGNHKGRIFYGERLG